MMAFLGWFDNSTTVLTQQISSGVVAFQERYGVAPDVHPDVPVHTLWFGMEETV